MKRMFDRFFPDEYMESTYSIPFEKLYQEGYRGVIFDIDNTLVPHGAPADERAKQFHAHFSRIAYTKGGEKCHLTFADTAFGPPHAPLLALLKERHLAPTIICESAGTQAEDAAALAQGYAAL